MFRMANPRDKKDVPDPKLGDISSRLKDLSSRLEAEKSENSAAGKSTGQYQGASDYSKGYRLASEFVAGVLVGGLLGFGLDKLFGTLPLFLIVFLLLGFGAGILNMSRSANRTPPTAEELSKMPKPNDDDEDEDK
jgi:ATP synthase protein I